MAKGILGALAISVRRSFNEPARIFIKQIDHFFVFSDTTDIPGPASTLLNTRCFVDFQYFVNVTFSLIRKLQAQGLDLSTFIESRQDRNIIPVHYQLCKRSPFPWWGIIPFIQKNHPHSA
nr:MAG TPA: hypothetical protein [Caudoviricetes sp.]